MEKKYVDRKRFFNLDLNKWYKYKEKNERASLNISFGDSNSIIWINERNINEVTPESRTMVLIDNFALNQLAFYLKENINTITEDSKIEINILGTDKGVNNKTLKATFRFGKETDGFYIAVFTPGRQGIKFYLIPNERFTELKAYKNSDPVIKNNITKGYAVFWFDSILELTKNALMGKLNTDEVVKVQESKIETQNKDLNNKQSIKEENVIENKIEKNDLDIELGEMSSFMEEMGKNFDSNIPVEKNTSNDDFLENLMDEL